MGQITVILTEKAENKLRTKTRKKGDMSNIISELIEEYL